MPREPSFAFSSIIVQFTPHFYVVLCMALCDGFFRLVTMCDRPFAVNQWSVDDVCTWLTAIGMGQKAQPFQTNGVDGGLLTDMSANDLTNDLGLDSFEAKKVLRELDFAKGLSSGGDGAPSSGGESVSSYST